MGIYTNIHQCVCLPYLANLHILQGKRLFYAYQHLHGCVAFPHGRATLHMPVQLQKYLNMIKQASKKVK